MTAKPHKRGAGLELDVQEVEAYRTPAAPENPVTLRAEAAIIAEIYSEMMRGNPIGVSGGMGGMIPEKLLWSQVEAYCRVTQKTLNRWAVNLLFMVDSIRLKWEFDRMKKEVEKKK